MSTYSLANSNPQKIESLYLHHNHWLKSWLYRRVSCPEKAADLAQDTFVRLLGKTVQLDTVVAARRYLRCIADGLCVDMWRRKSVEQAWLETLAERPELEEISAEDRAIIIETICEIDEMLRNLPENVATAFLLSQMDGLTYKQIAAELEVSERMVKKYMARAMFECLLIESRHYQ
ncbi:sigma-70 family RNA polymerase sigma factor [Parashewanella tropica]|uniref:sigma-70 family RNA polymerase sigma factor n=1 Tax=Parashewanella tropica TaxID=2547970 RepID=UPI0010592D81|nr:sigma-70 family RNA polymerase sigma factor [Parashewanella tropica]